MEIDGQCHCGATAYTAEVDDSNIVICHCTDCQEVSSAPFRYGVKSLPNAVNFKTGTPKEYIKTADSGNQRAQVFCINCGTTLYARSVDEGDKIYNL